MATPSSTLAWRIPRTGEPGGLQFMGSQTIRHDWRTNPFTFIEILSWVIQASRTLFKIQFSQKKFSHLKGRTRYSPKTKVCKVISKLKNLRATAFHEMKQKAPKRAQNETLKIHINCIGTADFYVLKGKPRLPQRQCVFRQEHVWLVCSAC